VNDGVVNVYVDVWEKCELGFRRDIAWKEDVRVLILETTKARICAYRISISIDTLKVSCLYWQKYIFILTEAYLL